MTSTLCPSTSQKRGRVDSGNDLDDTDELNYPDIDFDFDLEQQADRVPLRSGTSSPSLRARAELTFKNLLLHSQLESPGAQVIMPGTAPSTMVSDVTQSPADSEQALRAFGVQFKTLEPCPSELEDYIHQVVRKQRVGGDSPTAKTINRLQPALARNNEGTIMRVLAPLLMFQDRFGDPSNGEDLIVHQNVAHFHRRWVTNSAGIALTKAIPDVTNGYGTRQCMAVFGSQAAFTREEETILLQEPLTDEPVLCPFITGQYKSPEVGLPKADRQACRDGIAVINHTLRLYERARIQPRVFDTVHWSITSNGVSANLYLHWTGIVEGERRHYMKLFEEARLGPGIGGVDPNLLYMRRYLRNILEDAQIRRLHRIKFVLKKIQDSSNQRAIAGSMSRTIGRSNRMPTTPKLGLRKAPQTPMSAPRTPTHTSKRLRVEHPKEWDEDDGEPDELAE
ncbi:hypothetical protein N0V95_000503 [Ascochyta clinopodiicola]|nr:hypothetical protein N0V95_000503 [Ascochyta clinopodiicola]